MCLAVVVLARMWDIRKPSCWSCQYFSVGTSQESVSEEHDEVLLSVPECSTSKNFQIGLQVKMPCLVQFLKFSRKGEVSLYYTSTHIFTFIQTHTDSLNQEDLGEIKNTYYLRKVQDPRFNSIPKYFSCRLLDINIDSMKI